MSFEFVWDKRKADANFKKHGISFSEAVEVFADPRSSSYPDDLHSVDEERFILLGLSTKLRVLLVVHTEINSVDSNVIIRIISARKATPLERKQYEKG